MSKMFKVGVVLSFVVLLVNPPLGGAMLAVLLLGLCAYAFLHERAGN